MNSNASSSKNNNSKRKSSSLVQCKKCKKQVEAKGTVTCSACNNKYEFDCIGLSEKLYRLMGTESKKNWKCKLCASKPRINKDKDFNSNVTVRKKPTSSKTSSGNSNCEYQNMTPTNIISQNNVIDSYSCDSQILTQNSDESSIILSSSERLSRSADCLTGFSDNMDDLQEKNDRLTSELLSTQSELENTLIENSELKRKICKLTNEITALKGLCQSSMSTRNTPKSSHKKRRISIQDKQSTPMINRILSADHSSSSPIETNNNFVYLHEKITHLQYELSNAKKEIKILKEEIEALCSKHQRKSHKCSNIVIDPKLNENTGKIMIYGTQQCVGLASALLVSRQNSKYDRYFVTANTKPYATTKEILKDCHSMKVRDMDKIVLCVGENDCDPKSVLNNLEDVLKNNVNNFVLVLNVVKNKHLNTYLLNKTIKKLCERYKNCYYVNCYSKYCTLSDICYSVNHVIDCIDYNRKFLNLNELKKHINRGSNPNPKQNIANNPHVQMDTIPHISPGRSNVVNNEDTKSCKAKKGTIPYYFPVVKNSDFFRD